MPTRFMNSASNNRRRSSTCRAGAGPTWRYAIPGRGAVDWPETLRLLVAAGYRGGLSVELEDADFHGTGADEKRGLILAREFLERC